MPRNKDRLHVALHARAKGPKMPEKEDTYHWALILGPKSETEGNTGMRFHAKNAISEDGVSVWEFQERESSLTATSMILVRVMIAKVNNRDRLISILRNVPIRPHVLGWNCVEWVKEALELLEKDGKALGNSVTEWRTVRNAAMDYCQRKKDEHRFDGKAQFDMITVPTYDLLERRETLHEQTYRREFV